MNTRPSLVRSVPYWVLIVVSVASLAFGAWLVVDKLSTMTTTLADGSATGVEVYAGQSWIVFGAAFAGAGIVGIVAALSLAVVRSLLPAAPVQVVEAIDWTTASADDDTTTDAGTALGVEADAVPVAARVDETDPAARR